VSPRLLPVDLVAQLVPGTFAHGLHHRVELLELSAIDAHGKALESPWQSRATFIAFWHHRAPVRVMEACGSALHCGWGGARWVIR